MKHEIIELHNVQIIGMAKKIAFDEAKKECPKFWGEYVEKIIKPVVFEKQEPNEFQRAAFDNGVGEFGVRATSVDDVNKVSSGLITMRRVIFSPSVEIKDELKNTSVNITCYDRDGKIVKRVTSSDPGTVEDPEQPTPSGGGDTPSSGGNDTPSHGGDDEPDEN